MKKKFIKFWFNKIGTPFYLFDLNRKKSHIILLFSEETDVVSKSPFCSKNN